MKKNYNKTNYFTGSIYWLTCPSKEDFLKIWLPTNPEWVKFQLEEGDNGQVHWQYTLKTRGKQTSCARWVKLLPGKVDWIDGCRKVTGSQAYCTKDSTRLAGPFFVTYSSNKYHHTPENFKAWEDKNANHLKQATLEKVHYMQANRGKTHVAPQLDDAWTMKRMAQISSYEQVNDRCKFHRL